jgi:hypothetical protein
VPQCFAVTSGTKTTSISKPDCTHTIFQLQQLQHPFSLLLSCPFRYGVLFATIISWIPGTSVSYLTAALPGGEDRFEYFKRVSSNQPQRLHRSTVVARYIKGLPPHCMAKGRPKVEPHFIVWLCSCAHL